MKTSPQGFIATATLAPGKVKGFAVLVEPPSAASWSGEIRYGHPFGNFRNELIWVWEWCIYPKIATFIGKMMNGSWVPYFSEMAMIRHQD